MKSNTNRKKNKKMKHIKDTAPKCAFCTTNINDPKRYAFIFESNRHPADIHIPKWSDIRLKMNYELFEELPEPVKYITIHCPTFDCYATFEIYEEELQI